MINFFYENSEAEILSCLKQFDLSMPRSISSRTHALETYASKLYRTANVIIARENGESVGVCAFYTNRSDYAYLTLIAVSPQHGRKGYGSVLLKMAEKTARDMKLPCMILEVDIQNSAAISFYCKHDYYTVNDGETNLSIFMQKRLQLFDEGKNEK